MYQNKQRMEIKAYFNSLTGPAITVRVGTKSSLVEESTNWTLPQRLISHHSVFFRGACLDGSRKEPENIIELADDEPGVFALFVEWLYYGAYTTAPSSTLQSCTTSDRISVNVKCWVLGNKLSSAEFKSYAMRRIYTQHVNGTLSRPIDPRDVRFASENSSKTSNLWQFTVHLAATNIGDRDRAHGSVDEWDKLLEEHSDLRRLFVERLRSTPTEWHFMKGEGHYVQENDTRSMTVDIRLIGAKSCQPSSGPPAEETQSPDLSSAPQERTLFLDQGQITRTGLERLA